MGDKVEVVQKGAANGAKFGKACKSKWSYGGYCDIKDYTRNVGETCGHNNHCKRGNCRGYKMRGKAKKKLGVCTLLDVGDKVEKVQIAGSQGALLGKACKTGWAYGGYCDWKDGTRKE